MGLMLCDSSSGVWEMSEDGTFLRKLPCELPWPCSPCAGPGCTAFCCAQTRECLCLSKQDGSVISTMPAPPGVSSMCFSACGRYLYQLGSEADCIHTRCTATGELLFAAPVGVFPRTMQMNQTGELILAAGGAVREAHLLRVPELLTERVIHTRHPCFAADFWRDGVVLVCAVEGEDIQTAVYTLGFRGVRPRRLIELPGQPGTVCACPDGVTALLSTRDGLMKLDLLKGRILWNQPAWALCMRVECRGKLALVSDTLDGRVCLLSHEHPWEQRILFSGVSAQACFLERSV